MSDRAAVEVVLEGGDKAAAGVNKLNTALGNAEKAGKGAGKSTGDLAKGSDSLVKAVGETNTSLGSMVTHIAGIAGPMALAGFAIGKVVNYFSEASDAAKDFQEKTGTTSRRTGVEVSTLRDTYSKLEVETLQSAEANDAFVRSMEDTTYSGADAINSLRGLDVAATLSGRSITELGALMQALSGSLNVHGLAQELDTIDEAAKKLGVNGGPKAFQDTITALRPVLSQMSGATEEARSKVYAFAATLQKKMAPEAARQGASGVLNYAIQHRDDIQRITGYNPHGENGEIKDPMELVKNLRKATKGKSYFARLARKELGGYAGQALVNLDDDAVEKTAGQIVQSAHETHDKKYDEDMARINAMVAKNPDMQRERLKAQSVARKRRIGAGVASAQDKADQANEDLLQGVTGPARTFEGGGTSVGADAAVGAEHIGANTSKGLSEAARGTEGIWSNIVKGMREAFKGATPTAKEIGDAVVTAQREAPPVIKQVSHPNARKGN